MSVKQLNSQNFSNVGGSLKCNLPGIVFVMFKTDNSEPCQQAIPLFQQMSQRDMRLMWSVLDVSQFRNIVGIAKNTSTPIKAVPMFVLYVDGRPHANYKGHRTYDGIRGFLDKMLANITIQQQTFTQTQQQTQGGYFPQTGGQNEPKIDLREEHMNTPNLTPHNAPYMAMGVRR